MMNFKSLQAALSCMFLCFLMQGNMIFAQDSPQSGLPDVSKWKLPEDKESLFSDHFVGGEDALNYLMQRYSWQANRNENPDYYTMIEKLLSNDPRLIKMVNDQIRSQCEDIKKNFDQWKSIDTERRELNIMILLALRIPEKLDAETHEAIRDILKFVNLTSPEAKIVRWLYRDISNPTWVGSPGGNAANSHACLNTLTMAPALIVDNKALGEGRKGLLQELNHMNTSGDIAEFNCMEAHWTGTSSWEMIKKYIPDPYYRRVARMIAERLWINRFLTWSPAVERITGPGSRVAPGEIFGCNGLRELTALGMKRPIWMNTFFVWDGWDPKAAGGSWEQTPTEIMVPDIPGYLQDLAWDKTYPNEIQLSVDFKQWDNYPPLKNADLGNPFRPAKYVNYQTENYAIGSTTSRWFVNTCILNSTAWWNNSRKPGEPTGSPKRFCALYPHYVFNGMCFTEKGEYYFEKDPEKIPNDGWAGPEGPWMRELVEFGQAGILQDRNTMILSYSPKPGTHNKGEILVKDKTRRASAAMYLFRWDDSLDGLFVNRKKVSELPFELKPGDWWFIEDGEVYAAVRPLKSTNLKGNSKTILEKRTHHIVLYQDNVNADNINGITDEEWIRSQSGFIVEMGNKNEYGSFKKFQDVILNSSILADRADSFQRYILYKREGKEMEMQWDCYKEEYSIRKINGKDDPWPRYATSPEFTVSDNGELKTHDAELKTATGNSVWLLSAAKSGSWVGYQSQFNKELPFDLKCPAGYIHAERFPFGKMILHKNGNQTRVEIDAGYQSINSDTMSETREKYELVLETAAPVVEFIINGINYKAEPVKANGKTVYKVNPYSNNEELIKTMQTRPIINY